MMYLWPLLVGTSIAAPPIPMWTATEVEEATPRAVAAPASQVALGGPRAANMEPILLDTPEPAVHAWHDEAALSVELSSQRGRIYYLVSTARADGVVAHWRQGPLEAADTTIVEPVSVPTEVASFIQRAGHGRLTTRVVATDFDDVTVERDVVLRTLLLISNGQVVGTERAQREQLEATLQSTEDEG